jgi:hypothetical protein
MRLTLQRETLAELTGAEMARVAGGATAACPTYPCITRQVVCPASALECATDRTCVTLSPDICSS